jgi:hypothetical protein
MVMFVGVIVVVIMMVLMFVIVVVMMVCHWRPSFFLCFGYYTLFPRFAQAPEGVICK